MVIHLHSFSVFQDGDIVTNTLHMFRQSSALSCQIGQLAKISSSMKDLGFQDFSKTQGDYCWQVSLSIPRYCACVFLIDSEVRIAPLVFLCTEFLHHCPHHPSFLLLCVLLYLMVKGLVKQRLISLDSRHWCGGAETHFNWFFFLSLFFKLCAVGEVCNHDAHSQFSRVTL